MEPQRSTYVQDAERSRFAVRRPCAHVGSIWTLGEYIGRGGYGCVYEVAHRETGHIAAAKIAIGGSDALDHEHEMYREIWDFWGPSLVGIPRVHFFGPHENNKALVLTALGASLEDRRTASGGRFDLHTVLMIGHQVIDRLESIHDAGVAHCDLKPENLLMGCDADERVIYLVDFGLSEIIYDKQTGNHVLKDTGLPCLVGTLQFAALSSHEGETLSRRDDMQSLLYLLSFLYKGYLPWSGIGMREEREVYRRKKSAFRNPEALCSGMGPQVKEIGMRIDKLGFSQRPEYDAYRVLLESALRERDLSNDGDFEWIRRRRRRNWPAQ